MPPRSPTIVGSAVDTIVLVERRQQQHEQQRREDQADALLLGLPRLGHATETSASGWTLASSAPNETASS
jgi:hypothetical protein